MGKFYFLLFFIGFGFFSFCQKSSVYSALKGDSKEIISKELSKLNTVNQLNVKKCYEGALNCKIASFEKSPIDKLGYFKKGALLIESSIKADPNNAELRFLRLLIQENAPPIVRYNSDIQKDCSVIKENFNSIGIELKTLITDYSKKSKHLHL